LHFYFAFVLAGHRGTCLRPLHIFSLLFALSISILSASYRIGAFRPFDVNLKTNNTLRYTSETEYIVEAKKNDIDVIDCVYDSGGKCKKFKANVVK